MPRGNSTAARSRGKSQLSPEQVREISDLRNRGVSQTDLARRFGVSQQAISKLLRKLAKTKAPKRDSFPLKFHSGTGQ